MVVFIGNLPKYAAEKDLCRLAHIALDTPVRIIRKSDRYGRTQRYALIPAQGESRSKRLIRRMQARQWLGATLVAREYQHRTAANERRRIDWRTQPWKGAERRSAERRNGAVPLASLVA